MPTDEYGEGEVLTGAELYLYLLRQNEGQLRRVQEKLREYTALKDTLHTLTERSRRRVLAPVAGGLAYYPAELNATNNILVLLGDGWFVERSAVQASEIAGRRIDFLRRESEVLQQEQNVLTAKQKLFLSELPEAQDAVAQLLAEREVRAATAQPLPQSSPTSQAPQQRSKVATHSSPPPALASAPDVSGTPNAVRAAASPHFASSERSSSPLLSPKPPNATSSPAASESLLGYSNIDAALATFDELDELTEDELIALEAELGDRLNDDEYVERVMTERMIAKKERRVRAELEKRSKNAAAVDDRSNAVEGTTVSASPLTEAPTAVPTAPVAPQSHGASSVIDASAAGNDGPPTGRREAVAYQTPGDIGVAAARSLAASSIVSNALPHAQVATLFSPREVIGEPAPTSSLSVTARTSALPLTRAALAEEEDGSSGSSSAASAATPSQRKERHVQFAANVKDTAELSSAIFGASTAPRQATSPVELGSCDEPCGAEAVLCHAPSLPRSTFTIGDVVEHNEGTVRGCGSGAAAHAGVGSGVASAIPPPPFFPGQRQKPRRKSLFIRELEGDGA
ncbi:hypothetical protein LSCM1_01936 [Leishmania martiniquensis]|uniref:Uncharacterized protein n=1 Tax=Leishmania martiniquensis TaxID=1580590 RepID=A0A836KHA2_9TRYP|nr:hypothetical protein LSCM1_01936 [Leishmania martiniquensis]